MRICSFLLTPIVLDVQAIASIAITKPPNFECVVLDDSFILWLLSYDFSEISISSLLTKAGCCLHSGSSETHVPRWATGPLGLVRWFGMLVVGHKRSPLKNSSKPARSQQWIVEHTT